MAYFAVSEKHIFIIMSKSESLTFELISPFLESLNRRDCRKFDLKFFFIIVDLLIKSRTTLKKLKKNTIKMFRYIQFKMESLVDFDVDEGIWVEKYPIKFLNLKIFDKHFL